MSQDRTDRRGFLRRLLLGLGAGVALAWGVPARFVRRLGGPSATADPPAGSTLAAAPTSVRGPRDNARPLTREALYEDHDLAG